jgi:hypothetical protein
MVDKAAWGRQRPLAPGEVRFVPKKFTRRDSRSVRWMAFDVLTSSYPGAIPGFGVVEVCDSEEACKVLCAQLTEWHEGKGVGR